MEDHVEAEEECDCVAVLKVVSICAAVVVGFAACLVGLTGCAANDWARALALIMGFVAVLYLATLALETAIRRFDPPMLPRPPPPPVYRRPALIMRPGEGEEEDVATV